jgi:hypothetical protein
VTPNGQLVDVQEKGVEGLLKVAEEGVTGISWGVVSERVDDTELPETVRNKMQGEVPETAQSMAGWSG